MYLVKKGNIFVNILPCADPEVKTGGLDPPPMKNHKNKGVLAIKVVQIP